MSDDADGTVADGLRAGAELAKAVPVYADLLQPSVREVGKGLETVARAVNVALAPLSAMVWGYERICGWLEAEVTRRLGAVPPDRIATPNPHVVGPAIEALRYAAYSEDLRSLFAQLIATSMDAEAAERAHPTFVEILRQISADEAKIIPLFQSNTYHPILSVHTRAEDGETRVVMRHWSTVCVEAGCDLPGYAAAYVGNLARLGLIEFTYEGEVERRWYDEMERHEAVASLLTQLRGGAAEVVVERGVMMRTMLGQMFIDACIGETSGTQAKVSHVTVDP